MRSGVVLLHRRQRPGPEVSTNQDAAFWSTRVLDKRWRFSYQVLRRMFLRKGDLGFGGLCPQDKTTAPLFNLNEEMKRHDREHACSSRAPSPEAAGPTRARSAITRSCIHAAACASSRPASSATVPGLSHRVRRSPSRPIFPWRRPRRSPCFRYRPRALFVPAANGSGLPSCACARRLRSPPARPAPCGACHAPCSIAASLRPSGSRLPAL